MSRKCIFTSFAGFGILLLSLINNPIYGGSYCTFHYTPVRTELVASIQSGCTRAITLSKAVHLIGQRESAIDKKRAAVLHYAANLSSKKSSLKFKITHSVYPASQHLSFVSKIPSGYDPDSDSH